MATSALTIITNALREIGAIDVTTPARAEEIDVGLGKLNDLIDELGTQPQAALNNTEVVVTLPASTPSLTIGPGQTIDIPRPIRIESAYARIQSIDRAIEPVEKAEYDAITIKSIGTSWPEYLWYDGNLPTGNVYFWPRASAPVELHVTVLHHLAEFATATTAQDLAKGYRNMLVLNLAVSLGPGFNIEVSPRLERRAANALRLIKRMNSTVPQMDGGRPAVSSRLGAFLGGL